MSTNRSLPVVPLLSRGKHRRPRSGACVMEFASFLAGERWSDHPACTHPLLSELARQINDFISDEARQALAELVPDLIGLTGTDPRIDLRLTLRAARAALPVVAEERQRVMAVAILTCERLIADLDGRADAPLSANSQDVLALAPAAAAWAHSHTRGLSISGRAFRRRAAPVVVRYAVQGIAHACTPEPDALLNDLLAGAIEDCKSLCPTPHRSPGTRRSRKLASPAPEASAARAAAPPPRIIQGDRVTHLVYPVVR